MTRVLVVDDEAGLREMLRILLKRNGYDVSVASSCTQGKEAIANDAPYDAVITDLMMPDGTGIDVLRAAKERQSATEVVLITAYATTERAVEAMRGGAYDYVEKPFKNNVLLATLEKALEKRQMAVDNAVLRAEVEGGYSDDGFIGKSPPMQKIMSLISRVANAKTSVLITGESGTGKEMVARAIHSRGERKDKPFVVVNCGAIPESLMESELFGHVKGSFTGADRDKPGLFRAAHGGTLFLDEVGELPLPVQVKLLRVLQERKVRPVGESKEIDVEVRVLAATNRDVEKEIEEQRFRQDLYYRLNVIRLKLPPLRERPEDVRLLADHLLTKHCALQGRQLTLSPDALRWIVAQSYPGNVRELENVIERAVTLALGDEITREDLPDGGDESSRIVEAPLPQEGFDLDTYLGDVERQLLTRALEQAGGVRTHAAKLLGMSFRSFRYRLQKYDFGDE